MFCISLAFFFLSLSEEISAKSSEEYNVKAVFLFHFLDFTTWPEKSISSFNICIYGSNNFEDRLLLLAKETSEEKSVKVFVKETLESITECHLLFIDSSKKKQLTRILKRIKNQPILSVSDIESFAAKKGMIGLLVSSGKLKLEINLESVKSAGIKLSSNLIEVATLIKSSEYSGDRK